MTTEITVVLSATSTEQTESFEIPREMEIYEIYGSVDQAGRIFFAVRDSEKPPVSLDLSNDVFNLNIDPDEFQAHLESYQDQYLWREN